MKEYLEILPFDTTGLVSMCIMGHCSHLKMEVLYDTFVFFWINAGLANSLYCGKQLWAEQKQVRLLFTIWFRIYLVIQAHGDIFNN